MEFTGKVKEITPVQMVANKFEKRQLIVVSEDKQTLVADIFGSKNLDEFESYGVKHGHTVNVHFTFSGKIAKNNNWYGGITIGHIDIIEGSQDGLFGDESHAFPEAGSDDLPF